MTEQLGKIPVVRQEQQSLAVAVEAAYRINPPLDMGKEFAECPALPGIVAGAEHIPGFVENDINLAFEARWFPVNENLILLRIDRPALG